MEDHKATPSLPVCAPATLRVESQVFCPVPRIAPSWASDTWRDLARTYWTITWCTGFVNLINAPPISSVFFVHSIKVAQPNYPFQSTSNVKDLNPNSDITNSEKQIFQNL